MKESEALSMGLMRGGNPTLSVGPSYVLPPPKTDGSFNQVSASNQLRHTISVHYHCHHA